MKRERRERRDGGRERNGNTIKSVKDVLRGLHCKDFSSIVYILALMPNSGMRT